MFQLLVSHEAQNNLSTARPVAGNRWGLGQGRKPQLGRGMLFFIRRFHEHCLFFD